MASERTPYQSATTLLTDHRTTKTFRSQKAPALALGSSHARREKETELRLDYKDISAARFVIVVHGVPIANEANVASASGSSQPRHTRPSSPLLDEARAIRAATAYAPALFSPLLLSAWRGREMLTLELIAATLEEADADDAKPVAALTDYAKAVLFNGLGRYEDAAVAAQRACTQEDLDLWAGLELVEAGVRSDVHALAADALRAIEERACAGTDWALGVWARSAALLSDSTSAEALFREAIERFERGRVQVHLARAQLVFGEWLRRENRRVDAREQLRAACATFSAVGAEAFAERARRELLATGETARRRSDETRGDLTPQEAQIACLARDGLSNPQIGARLFISPRTVQYHLRKVFQKLDITSRNQLARVGDNVLGSA